MMKNRKDILDYLASNPQSSSLEIFEGSNTGTSYATLKRDLNKLIDEKLVTVTGNRKSSKYSLSTIHTLLGDVNIDTYFETEIDQRNILDSYNFSLPDLLENTESIYTKNELEKLTDLQKTFSRNFSKLTPNTQKAEMDRLAVDLSWKSSQIEGNTYSLLETERLLKDKQTAQGKTKDEATMLLNHKEALDFIINTPDYLTQISVGKLESVHSILIKDLDIDRNIRTNRVGITGTNYRPLDNEFQIKEALEQTCHLINSRKDTFEKALLVLLMISYIQPFNDGNKRTARIVSNAILIANNFCPISFRSVDSIEYKKAMLIFYEQNNITPFKRIFIDQFDFAVNTYF